MTLNVDGKPAESGFTTAILGDPLAALAALAAGVRLAARYGHPLAEGDLVLAGAATAAVPLHAGALVEARVEGLGSVRFHVSGKDSAQ